MSAPTSVLVAFLVIVAANVVPAFGPPTWALVVYFRAIAGVPAIALVVAAALGATVGRCLLGLGAGMARRWLPERRREALGAVARAVEGRRGRAALGAFFVVCPFPSNAAFEAVGLARLPILPAAAGFLAGRIVSCSVYVLVASAADESISAALEAGVTSPQAVILGLVGIAGVLAVVLIDWTALLERLRPATAGVTGPAPLPPRPASGPDVAPPEHPDRSLDDDPRGQDHRCNASCLEAVTDETAVADNRRLDISKALH